MDFEKYTDRARGFIQSAQSLALREGHQQFTPEHILKVLLDDPEGLAAGLIDRSGGNSRQALAAIDASLAKVPKVSGAGGGQLYLAPATARVFDAAQKAAEKAGDGYVTVERLLLALALEGLQGARRQELLDLLHPATGEAAKAADHDTVARVRGLFEEAGVFDNLKNTRSENKIDYDNHNVEVTLYFNEKKPSGF